MLARAHNRIRIAGSFLLPIILLPVMSPVPAAALEKRAAQERNADALAAAALQPYLTARAYKGTRTTTLTVGDETSKITTTLSVQARCGADGSILRLKTQAASWGHEGSQDITGQRDHSIVFDGQQRWAYYPGERRYYRAPAKPQSLASLLGLPPVMTGWTCAPRSKEDLPEEQMLKARSADAEWTLVLNRQTGGLLRIERSQGKGQGRLFSVTALRDMAFNRDADLPDSRYAFVRPLGAQEAALTSARESRRLLP